VELLIWIKRALFGIGLRTARPDSLTLNGPPKKPG
jgi:hypothetical protein